MSEFRATPTQAEASPLDAFPEARSSSSSSAQAPSAGDQGLFTFEALNGYPLTAKYFNMKVFWDSPTDEVRHEQIKALDEWVREKATERKLADTQDSYKEIIDGILKQIGKSDNEKPQATFERVLNAVEAYKRLEMAKLPPVLDVHSMTPDEYKNTRA